MRHHRKSRSRRRQQRGSVSNRHTFQMLEDRRMLATFVVTSLADGVPDATDGLTTLREAINAANDETANPGEDSIFFQAGLTGQIALTEGELMITGDLAINGLGQSNLIIDGQQVSRVIRATSAVTNLTLGSLTIANGKTTGSNEDGGGILFEGLSGSTLTLSSIAVSENTSGGDGGGISANDADVRLFASAVSGNTSGGDGGGISTHDGDVVSTFIRSTISDNTSGGDGGGISTQNGDVTLFNGLISGNTSEGDGGGISTSAGNVTLTNNSIVSENTAGRRGGGIATADGAVILSSSTVSGNTSGGDGGGIGTADGAVILSGSTVSGNTSEDDGGGISTLGGALDLTNSTVSGNKTSSNIMGGGYGGGIATSDGAVALTNSTISGNTSRVGGGVSADGNGVLTVHNSIIAGNFDNGTAPDFSVPEGTGSLTVQHSIIGDSTGTTLTTGNNNLLNIDFTTVLETEVVGGVTVPRLARNSRGVESIALRAGSPAINAGDNALSVDSFGDPLITDSRGEGFARIVDANGDGNITVDIGAFETQFLGELIVSTATDIVDGDYSVGQLSLRETIELANDRDGADVITFASGLAGSTIQLVNGELVSTEDLTITGPGVAADLVIDAQQNSRVIRSTSNSVELINLTLDSLTITNGFSVRDGGGILVSTNLTLNNSTVTGNTSEADGGGIFAGGDVTLNNSTVLGNDSVGDGGGISSTNSVGTFTGIGGNVELTNSTVSGNTSGGNGGGISGGDVTLTNSTVSGNTSGDNESGYGSGGGISGDDVTLANSTVSGNTSRLDGGGISTIFGDVRLTNSTVAGNTAGRAFGGIVISGDSGETLTVHNSIIAGNLSGGAAADIHEPAGSLTVEYSIIGDTTGTSLTAGNNNLLDVDFTTVLETEVVDGVTVPLLTNNGGLVETIALVAGSPAIDAGNNALAFDSTGHPLVTDQRGDGGSRFNDGDGDGTRTVDAGAVESGLFVLGDVSQNGVADFLDISPFISLLSTGDFLNEADINRDGVVNFLDISRFINVLSSESAPQTFTVNSLADGVPDATDGVMTLREAIIAANDTANPEADFIVFQAGLTGEIFLDPTQGELVITEDLTITGPGAASDLVIDAQLNSRVIRATDTVINLTLDSLTIANGRTTGESEGGGGLRFEGLPDTTLTLVNSTVSGNETTGEFADGGGIFSSGRAVALTNSTVSGNTTTGDSAGGGGISTRFTDVELTSSVVSGNASEDDGGGIYAYRGDVMLTSSTVSRNTTGDFSNGGGISTLGGAVDLINSTASGNTGRFGGGIHTTEFFNREFSTPASDVTLINSTVSGNTGLVSGGGLYAFSSDVTLVNSTVSGNTTYGFGGGIRASGRGLRGNVTLTNSTVSGNTAGTSRGGISIGSGFRGGESLTVHNSIIAGNSDDGTAPDFEAPSDLANLSVQNSIIGDATGTTLTAGNNNLLNVDFTTVLETEVVGGVTVPRLADNGGVVETIALLAGSSAIDAGDSALAIDAAGDQLAFDQRGDGFGRLIDGDGDGEATVDIGAVEFESVSLVGDVNQNGEVDFLDIAPFISLLSSGDYLNEADIDRNGVVNFLDISPFIGILSSGGSSTSPAIQSQAIGLADQESDNDFDSVASVIEGDLEFATWQSSDDLFDGRPDLLEGLADTQLDEVFKELLI